MKDSTWTALKIAGLFAGLGILVSRFFVLHWLSGQAAVVLFFLWYAVLFGFTQVVAMALDEQSAGVWEPRHLAIGLAVVLLVFAAGIVLYWPTSTYSVLAAGQDPSQVPSYVLATEDEVVYQGWYALGVHDLTALGILTYGLTPFLLVFVAVTLLKPETVQDALSRLFGRT
jgi:uncharacterized membrane protein